MKNNINDIENLGRVNAAPAGRGLLSYLISTGVIGTGQGAIIDKFVRDNNVDTVAEEPIRQKLLERMEQKGIKLLTPKDLSNGNPEIEKQLQTMENAFYHPGKKGIFLGNNFKRNAILAHEMGHAEDPALLTKLNPLSKSIGAMGTLAAAFIRPQSQARLAAKLGTLGFGGTLASEGSASTRGYKMLGDAGAEKFSDKIQAASGLPTYILSALLPAMTYKGRKFLGAFK